MSAVAGRTPINVGGLSDEELVQLARAGHEPAFDAIVHRYRAPLVSYCRRWLDAHRAEEVVQHTLMKAFLCVRDDARPLIVRPWLYRVAHNAALNAVEKKGSDWEQLDENYDGVPQPPQVAGQRARFLEIVGEIEALLLNEFEGRCYADIAAELGTSESGVRGLLRRARRQLRETAAALLLPFPVLRELVRSDARGLQVDRAGDLIGTAGAAGGVGAAGGLAKVAAGVLAAGTIASGGTAIEHGDEAWRTPDAKAADAASSQQMRAGEAARANQLGAGETHTGPFVASRISVGGAELAAGAGLPADSEGGSDDGGSLSGVESDPAEPTDPGAVAPAPLLPAAPDVPVTAEPEEEPAEEEPPAGEGKDEQPKDGEPTDSQAAESTGGGEQSSGDAQDDGSGQGAVPSAPPLP